MEYIASFDIGTTGVKGVLIDREGHIYGEKTILIDTIYGEDGRVEQNPNDWWSSVCKVASSWWEQGYMAHEVLMISFSGQMQDCIPVDEALGAVGNAILYSDGRAGVEAGRIKKVIVEDKIKVFTGNHFDGTMPFAKMLWIKENDPNAFSKTKCFLISSKDYVISKLTGNYVTDPTSAATSGLMDILKKDWMYEWVSIFGINKDKLPKILLSDEIAGNVTPHASQISGFKMGTPVLCGAGDAGATTVGAGAVLEEDIYAYIGTTGWIGVPVREVSEKSSGVFHLAHLPKELLIAVAPLLNAGSAHKWIASLFKELDEGNIYETIEKDILESKPGELLFLPYLNGERCPVQDSNASGCFIGLRLTTTRGEMCRAVLEGVAFGLRQVMDIVTDGKNIERMTLIGGGSRSRAWCQIISDICGVEVFVPEDSEFLPSLGAASSAFVKLGWSENYGDFTRKYISTKTGARYVPNIEKIGIYNRLFEKYIKLYPALKPVFSLE